jgi:hypothetical protein
MGDVFIASDRYGKDSLAFPIQNFNLAPKVDITAIML